MTTRTDDAMHVVVDSVGTGGDDIHVVLDQAVPLAPAVVAFSSTVTANLTSARNFQVGKITSDFAVVLANGIDGNAFSISLQQATAGGKLITGVTAAGRTVLMRSDLTQLNTSAFLVANSNSLLNGRFDTLNGTPVVFLDIQTGVSVLYGTESFASRVNAIYGSLQAGTWDAGVGVTVVSGGADAWVDQKNSLSMPAVTLGSGPTYLASDPTFNGRPSITGATGKTMRVTGLASPFLVTGTKPYWWGVVRMPALITDAGQHVVFDCGVSAVSDDFRFQSLGTATTSDWTFNGNLNTKVVTTVAQFIEVWIDTAGQQHIAIGGVDVATVGGGAAIGHNITAIGFFVAASSAVQPGQFAVAAEGFCISAPAPLNRAQLHAEAQLYFGVA